MTLNIHFSFSIPSRWVLVNGQLYFKFQLLCYDLGQRFMATFIRVLIFILKYNILEINHIYESFLF